MLQELIIFQNSVVHLPNCWKYESDSPLKGISFKHSKVDDDLDDLSLWHYEKAIAAGGVHEGKLRVCEQTSLCGWEVFIFGGKFVLEGGF
eukprot:Nitzschia sp. Nitz4//scaffold454_size8830//2902//3251//NITZ4_009111-RA/size8830-snap-gene-0.6-mRNA-1//1//CDS//3329552279//1467//frame0